MILPKLIVPRATVARRPATDSLPLTDHLEIFIPAVSMAVFSFSFIAIIGLSFHFDIFPSRFRSHLQLNYFTIFNPPFDRGLVWSMKFEVRIPFIRPSWQ
jgi:hypothetical protein